MNIAKVGVELEGGWKEEPDGLYGDGSVSMQADYTGEVQSKPMTPDRIGEWIKSAYPDQVNSSCGLHVHISLKSVLAYSICMDKGFEQRILAGMKKWGEDNKISNPRFWSRLKGENQFCEDHWFPDAQAQKKSKDSIRYTRINFPYKLHGTIEFRFLPMFVRREWAIKAVAELIGLVDNYIIANIPTLAWALVSVPAEGNPEKQSILETNPYREALYAKARKYGLGKVSSKRWTLQGEKQYKIVSQLAQAIAEAVVEVEDEPEEVIEMRVEVPEEPCASL